MSYNIIINEEQRALIAAVLGEACDASCLPAGTDEEEASILRDMLVDLPRVEAELPGCMHGLCL